MAAVIICCQASARHTVMSQFWELSRILHCAHVAEALLLLPYLRAPMHPACAA